MADSELDWRNKVQACAAVLPISKQDAETNDIFQTYTAKLQLRIYQGGDDTAPVNLNESEFDVELKRPDY